MHDGDWAGEGRCELCKREGVVLTRHHLIPRMRHRNRATQKKFTRHEMTGELLLVCRACHNHIHDVLTEKQLASNYYTREALLGHEDIQRFVRWIANKPAGFKARSRSMKRR